MQGGIVHGLGATLFSQISFNNGVASAKNFEGYRVLKMKDMPRVQVGIISSTGHPSGAGEPAAPLCGTSGRQRVLRSNRSPIAGTSAQASLTSTQFMRRGSCQLTASPPQN